MVLINAILPKGALTLSIDYLVLVLDYKRSIDFKTIAHVQPPPRYDPSSRSQFTKAISCPATRLMTGVVHG
jgi:hypothetical protein